MSEEETRDVAGSRTPEGGPSSTGAVAVLGAGTMGAGIAQVAAMAGYPVRLRDVNEEVLDRAVARIKANLEKGVEKGKVTPAVRDRALKNLNVTTDLAVAAGGADIVIEAVPEDLDLKRALFEDMDRLADRDAILATNTSSLPVGEIAKATKHPERVIGLHFFNPVHIMRLLEIVVHDGTSRPTLDASLAFADAIGKQAIVVRDAPGFATSRLGVALGLEAMRMMEEGVASPADIDTAMELGYGHPMGPLKLTDLVGLDVRLHISEHLHRELGDRFQPPHVLRDMVAAGELGQKTGRGFYDWTDGKATPRDLGVAVSSDEADVDTGRPWQNGILRRTR